MAQFDQEQRGTSASLLGGMLNPITQIKYQYLGLMSIPTYRDMMKGSLPWNPILSYMPGHGRAASFVSGLGKGKWNKLSSGIATAIFGGEMGIGPGAMASKAGLAMGLNATEIKELTGNIGKLISKNRWSSEFKAADILGLVSKYRGGTTGGTYMAAAEIGKGLGKAQLVSRIGGIVAPMVAGITAGQIASDLIGLAFKGSIAALNFVDNTARQMHDLEFGGGLGPGFISGAAATERQRCIAELQRVPLSGRRFMGREASVMSGLL